MAGHQLTSSAAAKLASLEIVLLLTLGVKLAAGLAAALGVRTGVATALGVEALGFLLAAGRFRLLSFCNSKDGYVI